MLTCFSCSHKFLITFHCEHDGKYRCKACKDSLPERLVQLPKNYQPATPPRARDFKSTPGPAQGKVYRSPYVCAKSAEKSDRRATGKCLRCGEPTQMIHGERDSRYAAYCERHIQIYKEQARDREAERRANHLCVKCGNQAVQFNDGSWSAGCLSCNEKKAAQVRARKRRVGA